MRTKQVRDKLVLVTGAASGIGRAIAVEFARAGARVVVIDNDVERLKPVLSEIARIGLPSIAQVVDVSAEDAMQQWADDLHAEAGPLDVLVNNACSAFIGSFLETSDAAWRRILDVNVMGVVNGCRAFLPRMIEAGGNRRIVNVASAVAFAPAANMAAYAASKCAVVGLSDALALELAGTQVGVTCVCPGIVDTAITSGRDSVGASISDAQLARVRSYHREHGATPDEVAREVVRGVLTGRSLVLTGPKARPWYYANRLSRALAARFARAGGREIGYQI